MYSKYVQRGQQIGGLSEFLTLYYFWQQFQLNLFVLVEPFLVNNVLITNTTLYFLQPSLYLKLQLAREI